MDNNIEKEVFSQEELCELNEKLKKNENITLPESLHTENIEKLLINGETTAESEKVSKKSKKKRIYAFVAMAASFAIVVTSLFIAKPWEKEKLPVESKPTNIEIPQDYSNIEEKFSSYARSYRTLKATNNFFDDFLISDDALAEDFSVGGSNSSTAVTTPSVNSSQAGYYSGKGEISYGKTNEQVEGVSEADIIKNDGKYVYVVNPDNADWETYYNALYRIEGLIDTTKPVADDNESETSTTKSVERPVLKYDCSVSIIEPSGNGKLNKISTVKIVPEESKNIFHMTIKEMYVTGNKLIAVVDCSIYNADEENFKSPYFGYSENVSMAICFDITDKSNPSEMWRVYQDGDYVSSRLIGDRFIFLSQYYVDITQNEEEVVEECVPEISYKGEDFKRVSCDCICIMEEVNDTSYLVVSTLKTDNADIMQTKAILGGGNNVYCNTDTLYATSTKYKSKNIAEEVFGVYEENTSIYKFDIRDNKVNYVDSCSVKGRALNQFSMDEYNGYLRIATTSGSWGDDLENQVYVIDKDLNVVGEIGNIAPGETIKSVRFSGNIGYVVTFMQTDPLFVIDFSDPVNPVLKGELKITGFSAYLHPVGENLLLGVGVDGDENGQGTGMKISLFDVSDPANPVEKDKIEMNGISTQVRHMYIYSQAFYTHKALCWNGEEQVMYIPYQRSDMIWGQNYQTVSDKNTTGILAVKVDTQAKKLVTDGSYISNSTEMDNAESFLRVTYTGDVIMGYSEESVCSFNKSTQTQTDILKLN